MMTPREQIAYEIRQSWLLAEQDKRRRRLRRRAARRAHLYPKLMVVLFILAMIVALWGETP